MFIESFSLPKLAVTDVVTENRSIIHIIALNVSILFEAPAIWYTIKTEEIKNNNTPP